MQHSNSYTFLYAIGFTGLIAVVLAVAATSLYPRQKANQDQAKRVSILQSVMDVNPETAEIDYNNYISEIVINASGEEVDSVRAFNVDVSREVKKSADERLFPLFIFEKDNQKNYIVPMQGSGLWGPISAFLALEEDVTTIHGVVFDHEGETPGLGAEINTDQFENRYKGKKIYDESGDLAAVKVLKGSGNNVDDLPHTVDGLSGATMTTNGVTNMFEDELQYYSPYFKKIKS